MVLSNRSGRISAYSSTWPWCVRRWNSAACGTAEDERHARKARARRPRAIYVIPPLPWQIGKSTTVSSLSVGREIIIPYDFGSRKQSAPRRENHGALHDNIRFCDRDVAVGRGLLDCGLRFQPSARPSVIKLYQVDVPYLRIIRISVLLPTTMPDTSPHTHT